jgi:hypothetical protein
MGASLAAICNSGMLTITVCVDQMKLPFGSLTSIGFTAICVFTHGASNARKYPLALESKSAVSDVV